MKAARAICIVVFFLSVCVFSSIAQQAPAPDRALLYADSLQNAYAAKDWNRYMDLSYPGLIEYFGGQRRFKDYLERSAELRKTEPATLEMLQLIQQGDDWQCVIKKTSKSLVDGKKATVVTYIVAQSRDRGTSWQFVDVAFTSARNLFYIMPDMSANLIIPERNVTFDPVMALN